MDNVTVVTTVRNTAKALALMWESFTKYHPGYKWFVIDDASSDGANDYALSHATFFIQNTEQYNFGSNLDTLMRAVYTEYLLTVDSDVEVLGPIVPELLSKMTDNALCVADVHTTGECTFAGYQLRGQKKIDHSFALFKTEKIKRITQYFSWSPYMNISSEQYFDGGAMVYLAAQLLGYDVIEYPELFQKVYHYGGISSLFVPGIDPGALHNSQKKYDIIGQRLEKLRAGTHNTKGLTWNGKTWSCGY
jgi:glycosyltransferase involved in cell wall biosynthesis